MSLTPGFALGRGTAAPFAFDGRYRSSIIEADSYLLACQRYIELNAVPARMTPNPEDYRWTSFRANALRTADPVVTPRPLHTAVAGRSDESRRAVYRSLFDDQLPDTAITELRDATNGGFA